MISKITAPIKASMIAPIMPAADDNTELRQQPAGDQGADDADDDVADQPEAAAFDDHSGQPAGNRADDQPNNNVCASMVSPFIPVPARAKPLRASP